MDNLTILTFSVASLALSVHTAGTVATNFSVQSARYALGTLLSSVDQACWYMARMKSAATSTAVFPTRRS